MIYPLLMLLFICCNEEDKSFNYVPEEGNTANEIIIKTDKARYAPGESVVFTANKTIENFTIRYKYLGSTILEQPLTSTTWTWTPPTQDYRGYLIELYKTVESKDVIAGTVAVDVSSDWTKFPRYGFLSKFDNLSDAQMNSIIENLKDHHINSIQFYDWFNKHHSPLKMNGSLPSETWKDIANRDINFNTVKNYINKSHSYNVAAMSYNLLFGAWDDYSADGVSSQWMLFNDQNHTNINKHILPSTWLSNINITNPANTNWQQYIFDKTNLVYQNLPFDGWHVDQLGNRGNVYDYSGNAVDLKQSYTSFLQNLKSEFPNKKMVMNAVAQYGQSNILSTPVDIAYTEVWSPRELYKDLADVIQENNSLSSNTKKTVIAAYMNYNRSQSSGFFKTPSVLLTDAVIFAFGGSHIELGEHMLGNEYFPNNNLQINGELKKSLSEYYDFLVGYQNLLRDGGTFNSPTLNSGDGKVNLSSWPPTVGTVSIIGKQLGTKQIIHLINFSNSNNVNWRDTNAEHPNVTVKNNFILNYQNTQPVTKVWYASPDYNGGASVELAFTQVNGNIVFKIPSMQYWGMIVIE